MKTDELRRHQRKVETGGQPWVRIITLQDSGVTYDEVGFSTEGGRVVPWSSVVRVALGYEIHPIAIADWDFWAFQTTEKGIGFWVYADLCASSFSIEVRRRFAVAKIPPMTEWADKEFGIRAYVVWPFEEVGQALYVTVKRHWWSWRQRLAYPEELRSAG